MKFPFVVDMQSEPEHTIRLIGITMGCNVKYRLQLVTLLANP